LTAAGARRRTLYGSIDRLNLPGLFRTFDFPGPDATSPERDTTTVPPQALFLMNHPFVLDCGRQLARRSDLGGDANVENRIQRLFRLAYGRAASEREVQSARTFLGSGQIAAVNWDRLAHALLMANEFSFVD